MNKVDNSNKGPDVSPGVSFQALSPCITGVRAVSMFSAGSQAGFQGFWTWPGSCPVTDSVCVGIVMDRMSRCSGG